jgi:hypothetical protein
VTEHAVKAGKPSEAKAVNDLVKAILARPEHAWKSAKEAPK